MITKLYLTKNIKSAADGITYLAGRYTYDPQFGYLSSVSGDRIMESVYIAHRHLFKKYLFVTYDGIEVYEGDAFFMISKEGGIIENSFNTHKDYNSFEAKEQCVCFFHYSNAQDYLSGKTGIRHGDLVVVTSSSKLFDRNVVEAISKDPIFNSITNYAVIKEESVCRVVTRLVNVTTNRSNIAAIGIIDFEGNQSIAPVDCIREIEIKDLEQIIHKHNSLNYDHSY